MANAHTTPFVKRMRTQGGTIYTFSSATEDIGLNINERNNIVKMSHYALLNIPSIDVPSNSFQNRFNTYAIPGAFQSFLNSGSVKDGRVVIAESFQDYALNLECNLLNLSTYNAELPNTVSERVFWKWLKETGAIRWVNDPAHTGYWKEEIDASEGSYSSVVKAIGQISAGAVRNGTFGTYNETYILVPTSFGQTDVYFKQIEDDNYRCGMKIPPAPESGNNRILGRENYMKPHPDGLDFNAYYDMADSSIAAGTYAMSYFNNSIYTPGWWYTYENIYPAPNSYCTDASTLNPAYPALFDVSLRYSGPNTIDFKRSKLDCVSIELDLDHLKTLYSDPTLTFDKMAIEDAADDNYDFNAVLLYYSVKNKTNDTVLATNLLGILFLDPPDGNTANFPLSEIRIPSITKLQSGTTGFGTSYSFRLNIKSDYMLDDSLSIVTDSTASQIVLEDFSQVFDSLSKSLEILNQHTGTISYITEQYLDISSSQNDMANDIADLQYQVNDISRDIVGTENTIPMFIAGEDPIGDSSIYMYQGKVGFFNNKPSYPVEFDSSIKTKDIYLEYAIRDTSNNVLLGYGSPLQLGSSTNYRAISMYTGNLLPSITIDISSNIKFNDFLFSPFVRDTCLGSGLRWSSGYLYVDASTVAGGVTAAYVDGSLALKANYTYVDGSLASLKTYINGSLGTLNASINTAFSNAKSYTDSSLATMKIYIDGSLETLNASINIAFSNAKSYTDGSLALKVNYTYVDGSLSTLKSYIDTSLNLYLKNASLSNDFVWNTGLLEVSLGSIGGLDAFATNASVNLAFASNASLGTLITKVNYLDTSLGTSWQLTYALNASIGLINASLNSITPISSYVNSSSYYDGSLNTLKNRIDYIDACLGSINSSLSNYYTKTEVDASFALKNKTFQYLTISTSTATWSIASGYNAKITLTTNTSLNIIDVSNGDSGTLIVIQDPSGNRLLDLPVMSLKNSGWILSTDASARDIISFLYDGSNYYWNKGGPYA